MATRWLRVLGTGGGDSVNALAMDMTGHLIAGGQGLGGSGWVTKWSAAWDEVWTRSYTTATVNALAVDAEGNVTVTGSFIGTVDFGAGPVVSVGYPEVISANAFIASYGSAGQYRWAFAWGTGRDCIGRGICVLPGSGDVVVTGQTAGRADIGNGIVATQSASADIFVSRWTGVGRCKWARTFGGSGEDSGLGIATFPSGGMVVVGHIQSPVDFGQGMVGSVGVGDGVIIRMRADGRVRWAKALIQGAGDDSLLAVACHPSGLIGVGGHVSSGGGWDGYVGLYYADGRPMWERTVGGAGTDEVRALAWDGDILVAGGGFQQTVNFGPSTIASRGGWDAFAAGFGDDGCVWVESYGGAETDIVNAAATYSGGVLIGGYAQGPADFGAAGSFAGQGNADAFVLNIPTR